jgi:hypothetical protein
MKVSNLQQVVQFDTDSVIYEFHIYGIFFDPRAQRYYNLEDSGCSCPGEWDDERCPIGKEDGPFTFAESLRALDKFAYEADNNDQGWFVDGMMAARHRFVEFAKSNGTFPG